MALSGSVATTAEVFSSGKYRTVILQWTATQDYATKETTLSWQAVGGGDYAYNAIVTELRVTIDGEVEFYKAAVSDNRTECYVGTVLASGTKTLKHDSDGYRNVSMTIEAGIRQWAINHTGSATFTLDKIPETSTIGATNADIESVSTIVVTQETTSYKHSIKYTFGSLSGYIKADGSVVASEVRISATSIPFKVPSDFYSQIPNAPSGKCTLECVTYMGDVRVGSRSTTFVATASKSLCAPSLTASVVDISQLAIGLTGSNQKLIRYVSTARCSMTVAAKNSATIVTKKIAGAQVTGTTKDIPEVETGTFTFEVVDSRGFVSTTQVTLPLVEYVKLTLNAQLKRTDATSGNAVLNIWGDFFNGSFGAVQNTHSVQYRVAQSGTAFGNYVAVTATYDQNTYSVTIPLSDLNYESAYSAQILVADKIETLDKVAPVSKGTPIFDYGERDFRFNVPLLFNEKSFGATYPENPRPGQMFFLKNSGDGYTVRIFNGITWL